MACDTDFQRRTTPVSGFSLKTRNLNLLMLEFFKQYSNLNFYPKFQRITVNAIREINEVRGLPIHTQRSPMQRPICYLAIVLRPKNNRHMIGTTQFEIVTQFCVAYLIFCHHFQRRVIGKLGTGSRYPNTGRSA